MFIFKNTIIVGISCAKIVHSNKLFCFLHCLIWKFKKILGLNIQKNVNSYEK